MFGKKGKETKQGQDDKKVASLERFKSNKQPYV